ARKAYLQSEKGKAARKAYRESKKGKATRAAYEQSEKQKASHKARAQSAKEKAYRKAYNETLKNTGSDQEQTKIAGKQAASFVCESNKARNNEPESASISPLLPAF
uniref:hypothetical protein n=1 Tax=Endozoicomonas sp. YOMI1 TaxID=2828739 RepID=UPI002148130C